MKNIFKILVCTLFFFLFYFSTPLAEAQKASRAFDKSLIVLAPPSFSNILHEVLNTYSSMANISISATFESSEEFLNTINDGQPANIIINDNLMIIRDLQRLGALNVSSIVDLASDRIVVAVPKGHYLIKRLNYFKEQKDKFKFIAKNVSIIIPDTENDPAGTAAKEALQNIGVWNDVKKNMIRASSTRDALHLTANGNYPSIIYNSDVKSSAGSVEILLEIPKNRYSNITYQAAIVSDLDSQNVKQDSENFMDFLKSEESQRIFKKYGFGEL